MTPDIHPIFRLYHKTQIAAVDPSEIEAYEHPDSWHEVEYKTYRRSRLVDIPAPRLDDFERALYTRSSFQDPEGTRVTARDLLTVLTCAYGEREDGKRPVPSGGQRYPLELYAVTTGVEDVANGVCHFDVQTNELEQLDREYSADDVREIWDEVPESVKAMIVVTAVPDRSTRKYGEKGYLFSLIEAGCVLQNIQLASGNAGIATRPYANFKYRHLRELLGIPSEELILLSVALA